MLTPNITIHYVGCHGGLELYFVDNTTCRAYFHFFLYANNGKDFKIVIRLKLF